MFEDIREWCEQCVMCQTRRAPVPKNQALLGGHSDNAAVSESGNGYS